jgi:23S rRNA (uridine2552-2'-O)-methyltransferase
MFAISILLFFFSFDRVEEPYAVLIDEEGENYEVELSDLPPDARPGDLLESLHGPVLPGRERRLAELQRRRQLLVGDDSDWAGLPVQLKTAEDLEIAKEMEQMEGMPGRTQDHYARKAKEEGYHARSIYKLEEIDQKAKLIHAGAKILDLGCSPGSWMQYTSKKVGPKGHVVGIDLKPIKPVNAQNITVLQGDIFQTSPEDLQAPVGQAFDVVMSDMAPNTCGDRFTDHMRSVELCRRAFSVAQTVLRPGGAFVCKIFEGSELNDFIDEIKGFFASLRRIKPKGTRSESVELFVVAQGFNATSKQDEESSQVAHLET